NCFHTTESEMIRAGADFALAASADDVTRAIFVGAKKRAAAMRFFWLIGFSRVERRFWTAWIAHHAAGGDQSLIVVRPVPVRGPLPDISGHVVESVSVRRIFRYRRDADESILSGVLNRKLSLVRVGHVFPTDTEFVAPDERLARAAAPRRELPFGFGRQTLTGPLRVSFGIFVSDVHHRIIVFALEVAPGPERMAPVCSRDIAPPLQVIVERNWMIGRRKNHGTGNQILRWCAREILGPRRALGHRYVIRRLHERGKFSIGDVSLVYEK